MSGLLCVYAPSGIPQETERYRSALGLLSHRKPSLDSTHLGAEIFIGQTRPSTGNSAKLVASSDGRVVVAFDGRLSNRPQLCAPFASDEPAERHGSDAAAVLAAYLEHGEAVFERLEGVWALALWDARSGELLLSRDRLGVRPLYYFHGSRLIAASEIKGILALDSDARAPNLRRIRDYLPAGLIDDWTETFFARVRPVAPGSVLTLTRNGARSARYWSLSACTGRSQPSASVLDEVRGAIDRTTPTEGDIGVSLSGGIDSSLLVGILTSDGAKRRNVQAFSIVPPRTDDESRLIDATVRHTGIRHRYVPVDRLQWPGILNEVLDAHDEPVQAAGNVYQFALRRAMAEAGCTSVVVGYGADEIFAGYGFLGLPFLISLVRARRLADTLRFLPRAPALLGAHPLQSVVDVIRRELRGYRDRLRLGGREGAHSRSWSQGLQARGTTPASDLLAPYQDQPVSEPTALSWPPPIPAAGREFFEALLGCFRAHISLLVRVEDRNARANGLELCAPFLDVGLVEMALSFPFHEYMRDGANKAILRRAATSVLAPEVLAERRKFYTPGNDALVAFDLLRDEMLAMLASPLFAASGFWAPDCKARYLAESKRRSRAAVWLRLYMVQRWYERIVAGNG